MRQKESEMEVKRGKHPPGSGGDLIPGWCTCGSRGRGPKPRQTFLSTVNKLSLPPPPPPPPPLQLRTEDELSLLSASVVSHRSATRPEEAGFKNIVRVVNLWESIINECDSI